MLLSRRNVRIKVMQVLYSHLQDKDIPLKNLEGNLKTNIHNSLRLFLYELYLICKTAEYSVEDTSLKAAKHLPTEKDKQVSVRVFHNPIVQKIVLDEEFKKKVQKEHFELILDKDFTRKFFHELEATEEYRSYISNESDDVKADKKILLHLYHNILQKSELFTQHLEDNFNNWNDDATVLTHQLSATIDGIAKQAENEMESGEKKAIKLPKNTDEENEFALALLDKTYTNLAYIDGLIQRKLKNWDMDRVAQTDLVVIKMAIAEMLYFPSIPVKATMNEYIDIVKSYSTPKSNEFVNGILDRVMKDLQAQKLIKKEGRGLIEL